ncbi:hypothetical protein MAPG_09364 [Magnaporthiopsis poae ATCC 64411]|uniref:Glycoside hydrolase family 43 protein n=1 Tax=Magnaporthiopsis poae (strain ATCC 64411 / 73-15) TaxID=644358 RepID=A0A0C4E9R6_MAGP6|nr:hypothetical protein MAPG_09364 [Magnaporthiopsis poae ATCC 64411]
MSSISKGFLLLSGFVLAGVAGQGTDALGLRNGYINLTTANFNLRLVRDAQVLASLKPAGDAFNFLPFDYLPRRARNLQYHWGDITFRYRRPGNARWISGDSSAARQTVSAVAPQSPGVLSSSRLGPTLGGSAGPLNITREWLDVSGDLGLRFTIQNSGPDAVELGSLGFPAEFNSIFTRRNAAEMQRLCSLSDPYIGMHAGHIRVSPIRGTGAALVVTPLGDTPMEAYRNLQEGWYEDTGYGSQTFEGFYEWQVLSKAWAETEWSGQTQWNPASSRTLKPGESLQFGVRFSVAKGGVRDLDATIRSTGTPTAVGVPGYIVPRGVAAQLFLHSASEVKSISSEPASALQVSQSGDRKYYTVTPSSSAWGRARLSVQYADGKVQTIHYYITKSSTEAVADLGRFLTTKQWFNDSSDPFGRSPSVMTYDHETGSIVTQDSRVWVAGLSDEGGAGSFLAAFMKQAIQPNADEVAKLETFVDGVLRPKLQTTDLAVRKSLFFYDPAVLPSYPYSKTLDWTSWTSWNRAAASAIDRAYNYVHVAAAYWSLYRVARAYPGLTKSHTWEWYLSQAHGTVMRAMKNDVGYNRVGLMGETVFGEILADLGREGRTAQADAFSAAMRSRAARWDTEEVPFGSEMAWDSTGQEGVYYWSQYFGYDKTATKSVNSVLGFAPTVPHWGWNGNARRYWDNFYGGSMLGRIERQIHHYGSGLNALVLLSAFRSSPSDTYLLRAGYGGTTGPLSNIHQDGFAAASFHSFPDALKWDGRSGDYGPGFAGLALGSGTYVAEDPELGLVVFGGELLQQDAASGGVSVRTTDAVRQRVFVGPLGVLVSIDSGIIDELHFNSSGALSVTLAQHEGGPVAASVILWVEATAPGARGVKVVTSGIQQTRGGWSIHMSSPKVTVELD